MKFHYHNETSETCPSGNLENVMIVSTQLKFTFFRRRFVEFNESEIFNYFKNFVVRCFLHIIDCIKNKNGKVY